MAVQHWHAGPGPVHAQPMMMLAPVRLSRYKADVLNLGCPPHEEQCAPQKLASELEELVREKRSAPRGDFPLLTCQR
eukprot:9476200-Pyramimonas_sp.AAC.1